MISERADALRRAISLQGNLSDVVQGLRKFPYDTDFPVVLVSASDVITVVRRYVEGLITVDEVEQWAEFIEGRDDIGFAPPRQEMLRCIIQRLANPVLFEPIDRGAARKLISELENDN